MTDRPRESHLIGLAAAVLIAVACGAGLSLWLLHRYQGQLAHAYATRSVLDQSRMIASHLATECSRRGITGSGGWASMSEMAHAIHSVEQDLQSVSVIRNGETVFNEQMDPLDGDSGVPPPLPKNQVRVSKRVVRIADAERPLVVVTASLNDTNGTPISVEVAMRMDAISREERTAARALSSLLKVSLLTVSLAFGTCLFILAWMIRREIRRQRQRRQEEHLAFSGVLANGIVHDFRNPMSSLRLDVQMLGKEANKTEGARPERIGQLAERIQGTLDRMDKVFQEFLFLSRPIGETNEVVDLGQCARESLEIVAPRLEHAAVNVSVDLPPKPLYVRAQTASLKRAIINILVNAEQFAGRDGHIWVSGTLVGRFVQLDIADSGPGISKAERNRVFDMFFTTRPSGTGLGLFLARSAVERSGGRIEIVDVPGRGACIRITLPHVAPPAEEAKGDRHE